MGTGDGGLVATLEAVDGSRLGLGGFFIQIVPLEDCSGKNIFCTQL